jgi:hypothetical protein
MVAQPIFIYQFVLSIVSSLSFVDPERPNVDNVTGSPPFFTQARLDTLVSQARTLERNSELDPMRLPDAMKQCVIGVTNPVLHPPNPL